MIVENRPVALSVIIPSYNEESRVGKTLRSVSEYLKQKPYTSEIIVVDDGSKDSTARVVQGHSIYIKNLKLLKLGRNQGKGWAVREGMLHATGRYRLFMDADGSTAINHWERVDRAFDEGADVVVGSRHVEGARLHVPQAPLRIALGYIFRLLVQIIFAIRIKDTQNGFKAFRAEAAERIFKRQRVAGWAFDVEILSIARRLDYSLVEVPITWIDDVRSRMTFLAMPKMLLDLLRIRLRMVKPNPKYQVDEAPQLIRLS